MCAGRVKYYLGSTTLLYRGHRVLSQFLRHIHWYMRKYVGWRQEVNLGQMISDATDESTRARAITEYNYQTGNDGYCYRKSFIYMVIAALCACQNQLLCGVLVRLVLCRDGKSLLRDGHVSILV